MGLCGLSCQAFNYGCLLIGTNPWASGFYISLSWFPKIKQKRNEEGRKGSYLVIELGGDRGGHGKGI